MRSTPPSARPRRTQAGCCYPEPRHRGGTRRDRTSSTEQQPDRLVAVIGLAYVALPLAITFAEAGPVGRGRRRLSGRVDELERGDFLDRRRHGRAPRRGAGGKPARLSVLMPRTFAPPTPSSWRAPRPRRPPSYPTSRRCRRWSARSRPGRGDSRSSSNRRRSAPCGPFREALEETGLTAGVDFYLAFTGSG